MADNFTFFSVWFGKKINIYVRGTYIPIYLGVYKPTRHLAGGVGVAQCGWVTHLTQSAVVSKVFS